MEVMGVKMEIVLYVIFLLIKDKIWSVNDNRKSIVKMRNGVANRSVPIYSFSRQLPK